MQPETGVIIVTSLVTGIGSTSAVSGGDISDDGGVSVTIRGVAYGTAQNPTRANSTTNDGTGTGAFNSTLTGLTASTLYYVRAFATNSVGTAYGNQVSFRTLAGGPPQPCPGTPTVTDVDNNTYNTVQIGTQCWMKSNLKVSKYRNGNSIPTGLSISAWMNTTSGAYAIYNDDPVNDGLYGKLYNHYAVMDSSGGLCPTGWHVPTLGEWNVLAKYADQSTDTTTIYTISLTAGGHLKSTATQPTPGGWRSPNSHATNSLGFTALPGGSGGGGMFSAVSAVGFWWSSSPSLTTETAGYCNIDNHSAMFQILGESSLRTAGFSVRCLKD